MLWYALLALVRDGDEVLVPDPGYPGYATAIRLAGGAPVPYAMRCDRGRFALDADALRAAVTARTRVLVVNAPQNPTGATLDASDLAAIAAIAHAHDLWVLSDEIYSSLRFDAPEAPSIAALPGMATRTVVVDGCSKTYAMTGWRLGYGAMPAAIAATVTGLVSECATCTPAFVQHAGLAALGGPQDAVIAMRDAYRARTRLLADGLRGLGLVASAPAGAFYVFADVSPLLGAGDTTASLADLLLREHGVACVPGSAYGGRGASCMRFACTSSEARLREAVTRIATRAAAVRPAA
jgi:aspartate/methionine/tyrosine aminotransferase